MHFRKLFQRRRMYTLFIFIGFASVLFLFFQMFTFKVLDRHSDIDSKLAKRGKKLQQLDTKHPAKNPENIPPKNKVWEDQNEEDCVLGDCGKSREGLRANYAAKKKSKSKKQNKFDWEELIDDGGVKDVQAPNLLPQIDSKLVPKGVLPRVAHLYQPNDKNMFVCVHSKEEIPFERFNDDYCDCSDFSDEPQTGACPNSRFYCTFQLESEPPQWVPSSRVDDGICDCCDGSDEEKRLQLPDHVQLNDKGQRLGVWQSPCIDRCQEVRVKQQEIAEIRKRGSALKSQYLEAARGKENPQQLYGPQGAFYKLSQACVTGKSDKYEYTVCLFKEVKQQDFPRATVNIGKSPQWISRGGKDGYVLEMSGGSRMGCPGGQGRKSIITLVCGIMDEVTSVQESEVCEYSIAMTTPAAC